MSTLKGIRETLCAAVSALVEKSNRTPSHEIGLHIGHLEGMIAQIDRHRPLGPDGKHGDLHTSTCGCEDVPQRDIYDDVDWARHEFDNAAMIEPGTGRPWPLWAGSEPVDAPDPQCVCGALWDCDINRCVMEVALLRKYAAEFEQRHGRLLAAVEYVVRQIRGQRGLGDHGHKLIAAWDARNDPLTPDELTYGHVTQKIAGMLEHAWNIIANAGLHKGGWDAQHPEWVQVAIGYRDNLYHPWLRHFCTAQPALRRQEQDDVCAVCGLPIYWDTNEPTEQQPRWRHTDQAAAWRAGPAHHAAPQPSIDTTAVHPQMVTPPVSPS